MHELQLAAYLHTLVPVWHNAEDVLQNTKLRLWEQFDSFQHGTDFAAWAFTIAKYLVRAHRTGSKRRRVCFSTDLVEKLSGEVPLASSAAEDHEAALGECVRTLNDAGRSLLRVFCTGQHKIKDIAGELGQTPSAAYQALSRVRRRLFECVERRLQQEAVS